MEATLENAFQRAIRFLSRQDDIVSAVLRNNQLTICSENGAVSSVSVPRMLCVVPNTEEDRERVILDFKRAINNSEFVYGNIRFEGDELIGEVDFSSSGYAVIRYNTREGTLVMNIQYDEYEDEL